MTALTCPSCAASVGPDDLICFTCGANLPQVRTSEDEPPPITVMEKSVARDPAASLISATVLRIVFPAGNVEVPAGTSVVLGRDPAQSLVAAAFQHNENVSRRHALIMVDDAGHANIRDENSTNGTFVNGDRLLPGLDVRLVDGDSIRLGADVTGEVVLPRSQPNTAASANWDR